MADPLETTADQLGSLIARGFQFLHPRDPNGMVLAVVGVRPHHEVVDVVWLYDEHDTRAARLPGDETDVLAPTRVLWQARGLACEVLSQLLALPDDRTPGSLDAGSGRDTSHGCWVSVGPGSARWLPPTE